MNLTIEQMYAEKAKAEKAIAEAVNAFYNATKLAPEVRVQCNKVLIVSSCDSKQYLTDTTVELRAFL